MNKKNIKKVGVLTSGGDAPGMNAAIRSVVRMGIYEGLEMYGIYDGYLGLYKNNIKKLNYLSVSGIINRGGTFLGSSRFPEFCNNKNIRIHSILNMIKHSIDALIVIGGNGSYHGAKKISEIGFPCISIPGTIDNDIAGTDYTIGYFTALDTIVEAIDRLRDTSISHKRFSIVEIMGRYCGDLTLSAAIAGACEIIILPEIPFCKQKLLDKIKNNIIQGKHHAVIAITEHIYDIHKLAKYIEQKTGYETRATVLGHIQRGGRPVAHDRVLASRMGAYSIQLILEGYNSHCVGIQNDKLIHYSIVDSIKNIKRIFKQDWLKMANKLF